MFEARSLTNFIGNREATIVVARSENELDKTTLAENCRDEAPRYGNGLTSAYAGAGVSIGRTIVSWWASWIA
jgi:hypothetical protein